jgi:Flp pilus assembly protein TadD
LNIAVNFSAGQFVVATIAEAFGAALRHHQGGNLRQAEQLYQEIIKANPDHAESHHLMGVLAFQFGRFDEAIASIRKALALNPDAAVYHCNLGLALQAKGQFKEAVAALENALCLRPEFPEAHNNLGALLVQLTKVAEALPHYEEALRLRPAYAEAHNNLGNAFQQQGKLEEAEAKHRQAIAIDPKYAEAYNNLGVALQRQGRLDEAVAECHQALRVQPGYAQAHNNLGMALRHQGKWEDAAAHFESALSLKADYPVPHFNLALVWLAHGDFERGWSKYEWRWTQPGFIRRDFSKPLWDGADLRGKTILLHAEDGLGDTLHFIRYASLVRKRGGNVIVECQSALVRLLQSVPDIGGLVAQGAPLPAFDVQAPLLSLPGIFHTTVETIPAKVPYLHADRHLVEHWRRELLKSDVKSTSLDTGRSLRVGIAWQGNPGFLHDRLRSIPLAHFAKLAKVPEIELISLQKGPGTAQLLEQQDKFSVVDLGNALDMKYGGFMDTAAIMHNLDLVVTSDTVIAHLAGALGVPVWVALAFAPDWRWLLNREESPWYPTMRLFRQRSQGDWEEVFERITEALRKRATGDNVGN